MVRIGILSFGRITVQRIEKQGGEMDFTTIAVEVKATEQVLGELGPEWGARLKAELRGIIETRLNRPLNDFSVAFSHIRSRDMILKGVNMEVYVKYFGQKNNLVHDVYDQIQDVFRRLPGIKPILFVEEVPIPTQGVSPSTRSCSM